MRSHAVNSGGGGGAGREVGLKVRPTGGGGGLRRSLVVGVQVDITSDNQNFEKGDVLSTG